MGDAGAGTGTVGAYCGSGVTAAQTVLALHLAGVRRPALYVGSWSNWCHDRTRPIARGIPHERHGGLEQGPARLRPGRPPAGPGPGRADHRAGPRAGRARPARRQRGRPGAGRRRDDLPGCTTPRTSAPCRPRRTTRSSPVGAWAPPTTRSSSGMHEASALVAGRQRRRGRGGVAGRGTRAVNIAGGLHHAMPARASGFCVYNDPAVAIARLLDQRRGADRLRGHRRAPRRRRAGDLLGRPAGADDQPARDAAGAVPGHRVPARDRRPGRAGERGQRGAAAGHRRQRVAARLPRRGAVGAAGVPAAGAVHPVRRRHVPARSARRPAADRGRAARRLPGAAGARRRAVRRPVGRHRRRRVRAGRGGAAGVDPPARGRHRRAAGARHAYPAELAGAGPAPARGRATWPAAVAPRWAWHPDR